MSALQLPVPTDILNSRNFDELVLYLMAEVSEDELARLIAQAETHVAVYSEHGVSRLPKMVDALPALERLLELYRWRQAFVIGYGQSGKPVDVTAYKSQWQRLVGWLIGWLECAGALVFAGQLVESTPQK